jgi:uncharacterized protein YcfJ
MMRRATTGTRDLGSNWSAELQGTGAMHLRPNGTGRSAISHGLLALAVLILLLTTTRPTAAGQVFFDRARVVSVTPVEQTVSRPVTEEHCETVAPSVNESRIAAWAGDVRLQSPRLSLAQALRQDRRLFRHHARPEQRCRRVVVMHEERRPDHYRVEYRYGGETFVRRMDEHPGEWVKVRVRVGEAP